MRFNTIVRFSDYFGIPAMELLTQGTLDPVLSFDSRFFIDPTALKTSASAEIRDIGVPALEQHLGQVYRLLKACRAEGDPAWRGAEALLNGKELAGVSLGYGGTRTTGSNLDYETATDMLRTAKQFIDLGAEDPDLFLAMPLLIPGIGPDTISDLTATAIQPALAAYTMRILANFPTVPVEAFDVAGTEYLLPRHPFQTKRGPVLLLPLDIVDDLPVASDWREVSEVCTAIAQIRGKFDYIAQRVFRAEETSIREMKERAREAVRTDVEFARNLAEIIRSLQDHRAATGRTPFYAALSMLVNDPDLARTQFERPSPPTDHHQVLEIVLKIVSDFKFLIEDRRMSSLLYTKDGRVLPEEVVQKVFFLVAHAHCRAWNLDITPEAETGNGPVDFKVSRGFSARVAVEIKLSTNSYAVDGYTKQLDRYMKGEETDFGVFILVDVGRLGQKWKRIQSLTKDKRRPPIYIDGRIRPSASNL